MGSSRPFLIIRTITIPEDGVVLPDVKTARGRIQQYDEGNLSASVLASTSNGDRNDESLAIKDDARGRRARRGRGTKRPIPVRI